MRVEYLAPKTPCITEWHKSAAQPKHSTELSTGPVFPPFPPTPASYLDLQPRKKLQSGDPLLQGCYIPQQTTKVGRVFSAGALPECTAPYEGHIAPIKRIP